MVKVASPEGNNQSHNWLDLLGRGLFPPHESKGKGRVAGNQNDRDLDFRDLPTLQQKAEQRQEKESRMSKFLKNSVDLAVEAATESSEAGALRSIANGNNFESQASHNHSLGNIAGKGGALESLEGSLRWVELELVTISLRCKEDLDEIAFWRFAPHQEIERARKHLREMIRLEEESELEEGGAGGPEVFTENKGVVPRLAKRVANGELNQDEQAAASRRAAADHSGCMSRMELEIYASDLKIALRREKRKVEELEGKLKQARRESRALHERIADLTIRAGGEEALQALRDEKKLVDEELVRVKEQLRLLSGDSSGGEALRVLHAEKKSVDEELLQAKDQLRRFNKEQVRDGRTIAELSEWCEKLQARLAEATIASAEQYQTQKVQLQEQQPASGGHSNSSPALCKRLPASQRSDTGPQLAKKLPSPAGHKLAASLERAPAMRPSPSAISVTRPKEASWFDGFSLGGNSASGQEGSKAPVAADSQYWFGRGNPLDKLLGVEALTGLGGSASSPAQPPADAKGSRTPQYA